MDERRIIEKGGEGLNYKEWQRVKRNRNRNKKRKEKKANANS